LEDLDETVLDVELDGVRNESREEVMDADPPAAVEDCTAEEVEADEDDDDEEDEEDDEDVEEEEDDGVGTK